MQELRSTIRPGARVEARGEPWQVIDVDRFDRVCLVTLRGVGSANAGDTTRVLTPFDRLARLERHGRLRARSRQTVLRAALRAVVEATPWTACRTAAPASIDIRAWQLDPVHAVLSGTTRVLLADEVGLGKTIQALLIASELSARGLARRVLILTPAPLRDQWAGELAMRFSIDASVFDHGTLVSLAATVPAAVNPWDTAPWIIASIDLAKRAEVRQALDATSFDLLVVDEAHHLTPASDRAALIGDLAARTPFLVLVTGTPHSGDGDAFRFLCRLGEVPGSEALVVFRRRARDVRRQRIRRIRTVSILPTDAERAMLDAALAYASAVWRDTHASTNRLAASVIARRACSAAVAAAATIARRLALLGGDAIVQDDQPRLPWEDESADALVPDAVLACPGLADRLAETQWLERLRDLARAAADRPSKLSALRRLIARTAESVLIFSEYRDVVEWCAAGLTDLATVAVLHGGLPASLRRQVVSQFNEGKVRILVATDAAGEGLNLHHRCRLVVNLELPWSPLRLDQRAGRVDRIGQTRRVHVRHLVHRESYEDHVLARLEHRRRTADGDLETVALDEEQVASCVLGDVALPPISGGPAVTRAHDDAAARAILHVRRLQRAINAPPAVSAQFAVRSRHGLGRTLILLYGVEIVDGEGRVVQHDIIGLRAALSSSSWCRRLSPTLVRAAHADPGVRATLRDAVLARTATAGMTLAPVAARLRARLDGLRHATAARMREPLVQGSLFERREERRAQARRAVMDRWDAHLGDRQRAVEALATLSPDTPRLIAAWLSE